MEKKERLVLVAVVVLGIVAGAAVSSYMPQKIFSKNNQGAEDLFPGEDGSLRGNVSPRTDSGFREIQDWEAKGNWKDDGVDLFQGEIKNDVYQVKEGYDYGHFALRFKGGFDKLEVKTDISNAKNRSSTLSVGTSDEISTINRLAYASPNTTDKKRVSLEEGTSQHIFNLNWEDYVFIKVLLKKPEEGSGPKLENVEVRTS